jgi:hypothetical protein
LQSPKDLCIEVIYNDIHRYILGLYEEYGLFERLIYMEKDFPGVTILIMKEGKLTQVFITV